MSQPTLSRLENAPSWRSLARMALGMIDLFCASFSRVPEAALTRKYNPNSARPRIFDGAAERN
jgi:hypothetical protein